MTGAPTHTPLSLYTWLVAGFVRLFGSYGAALPYLHLVSFLFVGMLAAGIHRAAISVGVSKTSSMLAVGLAVLFPPIVVQGSDVYLDLPLSVAMTWAVALVMGQRWTAAVFVSCIAAAIKPSAIIAVPALAGAVLLQAPSRWPRLVALGLPTGIAISPLFVAAHYPSTTEGGRLTFWEVVATTLVSLISMPLLVLLLLGLGLLFVAGLKQSREHGSDPRRQLFLVAVVSAVSYFAFFILNPLASSGVPSLPRYTTMLVPIVVVGLVAELERRLGRKGATVIGASLLMLFVANLGGRLDPPSHNQYALAERSLAYQQQLAVQTAAFERFEELARTMPTYYDHFAHFRFAYPQTGWSTGSPHDGTPVWITRDRPWRDMTNLPDRFAMLIEFEWLGGEELASIKRAAMASGDWRVEVEEFTERNSPIKWSSSSAWIPDNDEWASAEVVVERSPARRTASRSGKVVHRAATADHSLKAPAITPRTRTELVALFTATSLLTAALLFLVQPMVARMVLPTFGGAQHVWTTTMLFFQVSLLAGYGYTHIATVRLRPRAQILTHLAVLALPWLFLPIGMDLVASSQVRSSPSLVLLIALSGAVACPFIVVATSGPLLQRWFSWTDHPAAQDPYFLYAAGNVGSVGGLLAYPIVVERLYTLDEQSPTLGPGLRIGLRAPRRVRPGRLAESTCGTGFDRVQTSKPTSTLETEARFLAVLRVSSVEPHVGRHEPSFDGRGGGPIPLGPAPDGLSTLIQHRLLPPWGYRVSHCCGLGSRCGRGRSHPAAYGPGHIYDHRAAGGSCPDRRAHRPRAPRGKSAGAVGSHGLLPGCRYRRCSGWGLQWPSRARTVSGRIRICPRDDRDPGLGHALETTGRRRGALVPIGTDHGRVDARCLAHGPIALVGA